MIRINRLTDYGFVLLAHLASAPEGTARSTRDLASQTHIPVPTVRKVLKKLGNADLLESQRGAQGGYRLARPPSEIAAAEVIAALEGPISITMCAPGPDECEMEAECPVGTAWQKINQVIAGALEEITLDELVQPTGGLVTLQKAVGAEGDPPVAPSETAGPSPTRSS